MTHAQIEIYDTTLRDGTQAEDISLSVEDKLRITEKLDEIGIHYIEGGWPGSNPRDAEYFRKVRKLARHYADRGIRQYSQPQTQS